jgi:hypothetical protein
MITNSSCAHERDNCPLPQTCINLRTPRKVSTIPTSDTGLTLLEYALVVTILLGVAVAGATLIRDLSQGYHSQMTPGLERAYPQNYIPAPTPTTSP